MAATFIILIGIILLVAISKAIESDYYKRKGPESLTCPTCGAKMIKTLEAEGYQSRIACYVCSSDSCFTFVRLEDGSAKDVSKISDYQKNAILKQYEENKENKGLCDAIDRQIGAYK